MFHLGDYGPQKRLTIVVTNAGAGRDISTAATKQVLVMRPDETMLAPITATFTSSGTDGSIYITFTQGQLNQVGQWQTEAKVTWADGSEHSEIGTFQVGRILQ